MIRLGNQSFDVENKGKDAFNFKNRYKGKYGRKYEEILDLLIKSLKDPKIL